MATALLILSQGWRTNRLDAPITDNILSSPLSASASVVKLFVWIDVQSFIASALFP